MTGARDRLAAYDDATLSRVLRLLEPECPTSCATPDACADLLRPLLAGHETEHLAAVFADKQLRPIAVEVLSIGARGYTVVDPYTILRRALLLGAECIVLGHNHPSGERTPSHEDITSTRKLKAGADLVGVRLLDHIIIAGDGYASMAMRGEMPV